MFCALWIPYFRLQAALRYRAEWWQKPVAVVDEDVLVEMTSSARHAGVCAGMSPAQGLARMMDLQILSRALDQERVLSQMLLSMASSASAFVELSSAAVCTLDLQGARDSVLGDLPAWGATLLRQGTEHGLVCFAGIAENPDLALLAAKSATEKEPVQWVQHSHEFLAPLPLEVLSPTPQLQEVLKGWGISRLGELGRLKRHDVAARLGQEGGALWDRATGRSHRVLQLVRPSEEYLESFDFEHELDTAQPLLFLLRRFLEQLTLRLNAVGYVAAVMHLRLPLSDGSEYDRVFHIPAPTANVEVLYRVLDTHFESLQLEFAPTGVRLLVEGVKPEHQQYRFFENAVRDPNRFSETVGRILALVGEGRAGTPQPQATHRPDQYEIVAPSFGPTASKEISRTGESARGLPLRRYRPPVQAQVHREGPSPHYVVSDQAHGRVVRHFGPYRLSGDWWEEGWTTEEWDVELEDGGVYRISQQAEGWQVEGCYETPLHFAERKRPTGRKQPWRG